MGLVFGLSWNASWEGVVVAPFAEKQDRSVEGETAEQIFEAAVEGMTVEIADHRPQIDCCPPFAGG